MPPGFGEENGGMDAAGLAEELREVGLAAGLAAVGTTRATSWSRARSVLEDGRSAGRHGGMAFTYRKPARSTEPQRVLRNAATLVVGAWPYAGAPPEAPAGSGRVNARVARYAAEDSYGMLREALGAIADCLRGHGHRAVVLADDNAVMDREAAWRAGIGFTGKNANLLLAGHGSWFVLGSVVTDAALPALQPPVANQCGTCRRCIDGCPTDAIVAPGVVDARRCLSWLLQRPGSFPVEFREALGDRIYGCDDCQEVCPPARREERRSPRGSDGNWVDALELLALDDDALLERCARWYVPQRDPAVLRRNLLVVIGNAGDPADPAVADALRPYLDGPDELLAEHAGWAAGRLERRRRAEEDVVA